MKSLSSGCANPRKSCSICVSRRRPDSSATIVDSARCATRLHASTPCYVNVNWAWLPGPVVRTRNGRSENRLGGRSEEGRAEGVQGRSKGRDERYGGRCQGPQADTAYPEAPR